MAVTSSIFCCPAEHAPMRANVESTRSVWNRHGQHERDQWGTYAVLENTLASVNAASFPPESHRTLKRQLGGTVVYEESAKALKITTTSIDSKMSALRLCTLWSRNEQHISRKATAILQICQVFLFVR
jgi:hypothetical protein